MKANDMLRMPAEEAFSRDVAYNPMADVEAQAAAADAQKAVSFHVRLFTFVVVVAFALCALLLAGCTNEGNAGAADNQSAIAGEDAGNAAAEDADTHELVYIPLSYLSIGGEEDLFEENALWGVTLGDVPQILVMHIADGIIGENGENIPLSDLQPGDIVKATFTQIASSYPGQISVDTCEFVRHGGTEAITPYDSEITAYEDAVVTDAVNTNE